MKAHRIAAAAALAVALGAPVGAQTSNPNPKSFRMFVDGGEVSGVAGFAIDFEKDRDLAISLRRVAAPSTVPKLTLTLTPKGLNALSAWINDAGDGTPVEKRTLEILSVDNEGTVLIDWKLDGVQPVAITQTSSTGVFSPTAAVVFAFDKLTLVRARAD